MSNRFETLSAPPSLSAKDLSLHIRMQSSLPQEVRNSCSLDLLNPKLKLYDELTTVRFTRSLPTDEDPGYAKFCKALSRSTATPIPYRFFAGEYAALIEANGSLARLGTKKLMTMAEALDDIWRFQAYAALLLRIALHSETEDPAHADGAWALALGAYQRFFASAKVEDSYTYRYQTEEKMRETCREAWNAFLAEQVAGIGERALAYIQQQQGDPLAACLRTLASREAETLCPGLYQRVLTDCFAPFTSAISGATSLSTAGTMYAGCPKELRDQDANNDLPRAMLLAMKNELDLLDKGFGNVDDVLHWMRELDTLALYNGDNTVLKTRAADFYEDCTGYLRATLGDEKDDDVTSATARLTMLLLMPDDVVIVINDGTNLCRDSLIPHYTQVLIALMLSDVKSSHFDANAARRTGQLVHQTVKGCAPPNGDADEALSVAASIGVGVMTEANVARPTILAFFEAFPGELPLKIEQLPTVNLLRAALGGSSVGSSGGTVQKQPVLTGKGPSGGDPFAALSDQGITEKIATMLKAKENTPAAETAVRELISAVYRSPRLEADKSALAALQQMLIQYFVLCCNRYKMNRGNEYDRNILDIIAAYLPSSTPLPSDEPGLTLETQMLKVDGLALLHAVTDSDAGTAQQCRIIEALLDALRFTPNFKLDNETFRDIAEKILLQIFYVNAAAFLSGTKESTTAKILQLLGGYLPSYRYLSSEINVPVGDLMKRMRLTGITQRGRFTKERKPAAPVKRTAYKEKKAAKKTAPQKGSTAKNGSKAKNTAASQGKSAMPPVTQKTPTPSPSSRTQTTLNGIRYPGTGFAAALQHVLLTLLIAFGALCLAHYFLRIMALPLTTPAGYGAVLGFLMLCAVWLLTGLVAALPRTMRLFGRFVRAQLWWALAPLLSLALQSRVGFSFASLLPKLLFSLYGLAWLMGTRALIARIRRDSPKPDTVRIRSGFHRLEGTGVTAFLGFLFSSALLPYIVLAALWVANLRVTGLWHQVLMGYLLLAWPYSVLLAFVQCLTPRMPRFGSFLGIQLVLLALPVMGYAALWYYGKLPLSTLFTVLYAIYGVSWLLISIGVINVVRKPGFRVNASA